MENPSFEEIALTCVPVSEGEQSDVEFCEHGKIENRNTRNHLNGGAVKLDNDVNSTDNVGGMVDIETCSTLSGNVSECKHN